MIIISLFIWIVTKARERDFSKSKKGISCWLILIEIIKIREKFLNQIEGVLGFFGFQKKEKERWIGLIFFQEREREKDSIQKKVRREIFSSILWILFFFYFLPLHDKNFRDISLFLEMTKMETRKIACNQKNPLLNEWYNERMTVAIYPFPKTREIESGWETV